MNRMRSPIRRNDRHDTDPVEAKLISIGHHIVRLSRRKSEMVGERTNGDYKLLGVSPDDKRRPLAVMFYDEETKSLQFDRAEGVELQEFIDIVRLYLKHDYGK